MIALILTVIISAFLVSVAMCVLGIYATYKINKYFGKDDLL